MSAYVECIACDAPNAVGVLTCWCCGFAEAPTEDDGPDCESDAFTLADVALAEALTYDELAELRAEVLDARRWLLEMASDRFWWFGRLPWDIAAGAAVTVSSLFTAVDFRDAVTAAASDEAAAEALTTMWLQAVDAECVDRRTTLEDAADIF